MQNRRSAIILILLGIIAGAFFLLTDVRFGYGRHLAETNNLIDLMNQTLPGTIVGGAVSAIILLIGLWLLSRRTG